MMRFHALNELQEWIFGESSLALSANHLLLNTDSCIELQLQPVELDAIWWHERQPPNMQVERKERDGWVT